MNRSVDASETLRRLLDDLGLTQEEFARRNEMGIATANRWINGKVLVSERKLSRAIARVGAKPTDYGVKDAPVAQSSSTEGLQPQWAIEMEDRINERARLRHEEMMETLRRLGITLDGLNNG